VEAAAAGRPRAGVRLGRRDLCQGGPGKGQGGDARADRRLRDGRKVVLAVESGYRESTESWRRCSGTSKPGAAGTPPGSLPMGIWGSGAVRAVFPTVGEQRCWNHRIVNVLDALPKKLQAEARELLTKIPYAETRTEAEDKSGSFKRGPRGRGAGDGGASLDEDWERLVTFYAFPEGALKHLRTTNVVESPFAAVRLRTAAAKAVQESGERHGRHLEDAACRGAELPSAGCARTAPGGGRGRRVRQR